MKTKFLVSVVLGVCLFFTNCSDDDNQTPMTPMAINEEIVISANRGSGDITFINAVTNDILETVSIPESEPMYVVYVEQTDKIYVGDRAKNVVHVIDAETRDVMSQIAVGNGVFHMWANSQGTQLWVNNDIDNTTSVIDLSNNTVIKTIDLGAKPHDVFITEDGSRAFISILLGDETVPDEIFMFNAMTYEMMGSRTVGDDPHLFHIPTSNKLFVPCQEGGTFVFDENFMEVANIPVDGSHGVFSRDNQNIYITDLPGAELYTINAMTNEVIGMPLATTVNIPHNLTVNADNTKVFVTHSGMMADKLTIYNASNGLMLSETLTVGTNPFGIVYYTRQTN